MGPSFALPRSIRPCRSRRPWRNTFCRMLRASSRRRANWPATETLVRSPIQVDDLHARSRDPIGRPGPETRSRHRSKYRSKYRSRHPIQTPDANRRLAMAVEVVMPQMGESIFEGTITKWLKKPGDRVERDEPLFEISTDKVDAEIPSPAAGTLREIKVAEGQTVPIHTVVAVIDSATSGVA